MIEVEGLTKDYGAHRALDQLTFSIGKGEVVGFLGPNGAGKTTTMRILTGFLAPSDGRASVCGRDVESDSLASRSRIGYLPENVPLYPEMRVDEYLAYRGRLKGITRKKLSGRTSDVLNRCRIEEVRRRPIGVLSKGYRQRVGLADALLSEPDVLILDEPTVGLDPNQVMEVRDLLGGLREGRTVLLSTHILSEVEAVCDRVILIAEGKKVTDGPLDEIASTDRFRIEVDGPKEAVAAALSKVDGVEQVIHEKGGVFTVVSSGGKDLRRELFLAVREGGWILLELTPARRRLEELFLSLCPSPS